MCLPGKVLVYVSHVVVTIVPPFSPVNVSLAGKLYSHPHRENDWAEAGAGLGWRLLFYTMVS